MKTVVMDENRLADFYAMKDSLGEAALNEYIIAQDAASGTLSDPVIKTKTGYETCQYKTLKSMALGDIKPLNKDPYQMAFIDSLYRNQVTFAIGPAGSAKTLISMAYALQELEHGRIDRIFMFVNPMSAKGAAKLGFLPGDLNEKLLGCQIGNILSTKFGNITAVERLLEDGDLVIIPMSNSRGIDIPKHSLVFSTESQNMDVYLMKLLLQRIPDEVKVIIEGDVNQIDDIAFEGNHNGLLRAKEVFAGKDYVGIIELQNCYRGRLAADAEEM